MQHDNSDDPFGFWENEPTRQLKRTQVGTRAHTDTRGPAATRAESRMVPVIRADRTRPIPALHLPRNPLLTRIGLMVGVTLLLVPFALSLRADNSRVRASIIQGDDAVLVGQLPAPAPTEATVAPTAAPTAAPTTVLETTTVPVNPAPTEAAVVVATPAPSAAPTTAAKKAAPKSTTSQAPTAAPAAATQSADQACGLTYTIAKGDAWSTIASRAKVSMKSLLAANNATVNTLLLPGKTICLPAGAVDPGTPTTKPPTTTQPATTQPKPATTQPTTPPATSPPANTQPPSPPNTYSKAQVAQIIRDVWPDDLEDEAIRIATRESNLIPTVKNYCCYGLFQIYYSVHRTWLAGIGVTSAAQLYDPRVNATAALTLYNRNGWAPWAISTPTTTTTVAA